MRRNSRSHAHAHAPTFSRFARRTASTDTSTTNPLRSRRFLGLTSWQAQLLIHLGILFSLGSACAPSRTASSRPDQQPAECLLVPPAQGGKALDGKLAIDTVSLDSVKRELAVGVRNISGDAVSFEWRPVLLDAADRSTEYLADETTWKNQTLAPGESCSFVVRNPYVFPTLMGISLRKRP